MPSHIATQLLAEAPTHDDENADLELGRSIREMVAAKFGADAGIAFRSSVIKPTRPGTTERRRQDRIEAVLMPRLDKLLSGKVEDAS